MNTSSTHISAEILADLAEERVASDAAAGHISACSNCAAALQELREVIRLMKSDHSESAPDGVLTAAKNLFGPDLQIRSKRDLGHVLAALTFDSFKATPAFGVRSGFDSTRQLVYSADQVDIDLRLTIQDEKCVVVGQILRDSCVHGRVELSGITGSAETTLNELCEFTLPEVAQGHYSLRVQMEDIEVEVPELDLTF